MPALPPSSDFTGSAVTEGQFKTAISNLRTFLSDLLGSTGTVPAALSALGTLGGQTMAKTAAYTVIAADRGKLIECSGTFSLSLTAAATLGTGFSFIVANTGSGTITIDPNASETINGATTLNLAAGAWAIVVCNGTSFRATVAGSVPSGTLIGYQIFTASGTYTKATNNPSFVIVEVVGGGGGISGAGGTSSFGAFCSATGGATATSSTSGAAGGSGSGGDLNLSGSRGQVQAVTGFGSVGSNTGVAHGGESMIQGRGTGASNGGTQTANTSGNTYAGGGGGGYSRERILASSLAASETITVGGAGSGAGTSAASAGIVIVWEYA